VVADDQTTIVLDTSILLNFVKVERVGLLGLLGAPVLLLDQVLDEVVQPTQRDVIEEAIAEGTLDLQSVTDLKEVTLFSELRAGGRLGAGECAVLAVALNRHLIAGLQDRKARAEAERRDKSLRLYQTEDVFLRLLSFSHVTLAKADHLLVELETKHRFKSRINTFSELM